jgi:antitoxin FitA
MVLYSSTLELNLNLSIKNVPEDQVRRLRERAKANHRSLQSELRALIDEATGTPRPLGIDEIVATVSGLDLTRRAHALGIVQPIICWRPGAKSV